MTSQQKDLTSRHIINWKVIAEICYHIYILRYIFIYNLFTKSSLSQYIYKSTQLYTYFK